MLFSLGIFWASVFNVCCICSNHISQLVMHFSIFRYIISFVISWKYLQKWYIVKALVFVLFKKEWVENSLSGQRSKYENDFLCISVYKTGSFIATRLEIYQLLVFTLAAQFVKLFT